MQAGIEGSDGVRRFFGAPFAFREAATCWARLGYISMHMHRVRSASDVELDVGRGGGWSHAQRSYSRDRWERMRIWDASVRVQIEPLLAVVAEALAAVAAAAPLGGHGT